MKIVEKYRNKPVQQVRSTEVNELMADFEVFKKKLVDSMKHVAELRKEEVKTGFFSTISGKTNEELSSQLKSIGLNLYSTQEVLHFLIKLSHLKNEVLRGFYDSLVEKMVNMDKEHETFSGDLNISQKNEKVIVEKIKEQIEYQLSLEDTILDNSEKIHNLNFDLKCLKEAFDHNSKNLDSLQVKKQELFDLSYKTQKDQDINKQIINSLTEKVEALEEKIKLLESNHQIKSDKFMFSLKWVSFIAISMSGLSIIVVAYKAFLAGM